ncbi:TPA: PAS domain S-box protein [Candidatus Poribacteria bacterium]|nr:PAS domain S-box protein [Candidatus Poribacteria bacterium]
MNIERKFGHGFVESVSWGAHIGMFYRTSEDIRKIFIPYLAAGLEANERCVWVTAVFSPEETLKLFDERLPDLDIYIDKKQLMILSPDDIYLREKHLDEVDSIAGKWANIYNEALSGGYEGLRISADISWLKRTDFERFIVCERVVNRIVAENRIIAICAYDTGNFEISDIIAINSAHPYAVVEKDGRWGLIENAERIRIKGALEESKEKYRSIFNRASCGIILTDLQGKILDVNEYICHRTGYTREELIGQKASILVPEEIAFKFPEYAARLLKCGSLMIETEGICKDGSEIQAEVNMKVARIGGKECAMIMTRDITELKQAYEKLRTERDFNTQLLDTMFEGINVIDAEGKLQFANRQFCEMIGYTLDELKGQPGTFWVHPDDYQRVASHELLRKEGKSSTYECRLLRKDGTEISVLLTGAPLFDGDGVYQGKVGAIIDITELKQKDALLRESERRYRTMLEDVQMIAIGLDLEGNVTFCNKYFEKLSGYSKDELLGKNWFEIMVPDRLREERRRMHDNDVRENMHAHYEATILTKPGEERLIEWNNTTLRDATGNAIGTMSLGVDITDQKRMEEQLIRTERLRALGEMTAGIAHNFNNILTGVLGYAELLKDETNLADIASGLEKIEQSGIKARDLVKCMMDFVRIRKDKEFEVVDLTQVVKESIAISKLRWKAAAEASGISIEMKEEWTDNLLVDGDASELTEMVTNMIINSVEAMPKGGTITFRGEHLGGFVFLSISDTGIGMSEDAQKRVFEPFFTTRAEVGRGMGLATVYGTIRRHGGEIEVQSQLGEGTTFTIKLPYSKSLTEDKKEEIIPKARQANILVIDDEEHILMVFTQVLKGHQVDTTTDALEGVRLFKQKRHDALVVDLAMPKMNGWQIADVVRMIDKNVSIVLCTGWGVQIEDEEFKRSQVDFLLAKPFEIKAALSIIGQAVELKDKRAKG